MEQNSIIVKALPVHQPIGDFYICVLPAQVVKKLSTRFERLEADSSGERFAGIQRPLSSKRLSEISEYIQSYDATFPTSIILAIDSKNVLRIGENGYSFDGRTIERNCVEIEIKDSPGVARVIDGQHRLMSFKEDSPGFDLLTTIFIDVDDEDQAMIFTTINLNQTKVTKSLVYDLFELATTRSPQKLCHDIVKSLNSDKSSPFYHRIKMLGKNPSSYKGRLTQGTFVKYLLEKVSENPARDRNLQARKEPIPRSANEMDSGLIFREWYDKGKDELIYNSLYYYFNGLYKVYNLEWDGKLIKDGRAIPNALEKTVGFGALMRLLSDFFVSQNQNINSDASVKLFKRIEIVGIDFSDFEASGKGELDLYSRLKAAANL